MFNSNGKLILLHNNLKEIKKASRYDLLLSPQFYIVKREQLPVKYAFQAKKLAPSILEDLLPNEHGYEYEYVVQKDGDAWLFFAYRPKEIENFVKGCCRIKASQIGNIYFADQLKPVLEKLPIGIDEYYALTLVDGFATIVPRKMLSSEKYAKFTNKLRPNKAIKFKPSSRVGAASEDLSKSAIVASVLLGLLGIAFAVEGVGYSKAIKQNNSKVEELFDKYPQLQSKITRDSIKGKYSKIEKKQRAIREDIDLFSQLSSKNALLNSLELKDNEIIANYSVDSKELKKFKSVASSAKLKVKPSGNRITVEGAIKWVLVKIWLP